MKNSTKLFFLFALAPLFLAAGCYYPYYEEGAAVPAQPAAPVVYSGYLYSGYAWPFFSPWPFYYGPYFYSGWGPSRPYYYSPSYRPGKPAYRPGGPNYRPEWQGGRGGPRPSDGPPVRPDGPRSRSSEVDADQSYPSRPMPRGGHGRW